ncbi:uncharacterized protein LODBEIA_P34360 [Lodderomyces beijingensis]|uniref:N-alpha-acetyltransferase, 35 NatC auxiliary subunit n=1 Tax=Lodderomyces beijingensis TaxID=1775926 RepID=A0ABP0ZSE8_9ASCO
MSLPPSSPLPSPSPSQVTPPPAPSQVQFESLKLDDNDDDELVDITQDIFTSLQHIKDNRVVKSRLFELLEGTRALEALNAKLDTGLIDLDREEIVFDCTAPQSPQTVAHIQSCLLSQLVNWFESESLTVSVLSCRYVSNLLSNYLSSGDCSFGDGRVVGHCATSAREKGQGEEFNQLVVDKVLKTFIRGLCVFIRFMLNLARTFLYDEEDIMTRCMNLNFLETVSVQSIVDEIDQVTKWMSSQQPEFEVVGGLLISQLEIVRALNQFELKMDDVKIPFLESGVASQTQAFEFCDKVQQHISVVRDYSHDNQASIPAGVFSRFIQADMSNSNIPVAAATPNIPHACDHLSGIFTTIGQFVTGAAQVSSINQLHDYLHFKIEYPIHQLSVFARGYFQLFFIRDDKSIFGSSTNISELTREIVENVIGGNTILLHDLTLHTLAQLKDSVKVEVTAQHGAFMQDLESAIYNNLCIFGANPCRAQQLTSKGLVLWDTLQVGWESFEVQMFQNYKIGNSLSNGEAAIGVTSYIYFQKLEMMFQLLMGGVKLELYKPFEIYWVYWYAGILLRYLIHHLQNRVHEVLEAKIVDIQVHAPKRIKKLKSGAKKDTMREQYARDVKVAVPRLLHSMQHRARLVESYTMLDTLASCYAKYCIVLAKLKLVDFVNGPPKRLTSMEHLYHLRMKPWSSIGVPQLPTYYSYKQSLAASAPEPDMRFNLLKCLEILASIKSSLADFQSKFIVWKSTDLNRHMLELEWWEEVARAGETLGTNASDLGKILSLNKDNLSNIARDYRVNIGKGHHAYFVNITVEKKKKNS